MTVNSQVIVVKDKNVEMAIAEGLNILEAKKDEIEIEIIDKGERGFLGIGRKMAKVKLTLKNNKNNADYQKLEDDLNNLINEDSINNNLSKNKVTENDKYKETINLENGKIKLKQLYKGKYPVIKGDKNIKLFNDGQLIVDSVILTEASNIMYKEKDRPAVNEIAITVPDDKLKAFLEIKRVNGKLFEPNILPGTNDEIDFIISTEVVKEIPPEEISIEDVYWELNEKKICKGIKREEIVKAIKNPNKRYLITEGEPLIEGADARIEYLYNDKKIKDELEDPLKNIDYFNKNDIRSVKKGEILAIKYPLEEGKSGYNIYGEVLKPSEHKDIQWHVGDGIKIVDNKAIAIKPGRPVFNRGNLEINDTYLVKGDVDIEIGNININGDVFVIGNVCENFKIEASGMIKVAGNVTQATLKAEGDIIVKGSIINSKIIAGGLVTFYQECYKYLDRLKYLFEEMEVAIKQLKKQRSFKTDNLQEYGEKQIIQLLIDTKYNGSLKIIRDLYILFEENEINSEYMLVELIDLKEKLKEKIKLNGFCTFRNTTEIIDIKKSITDICNLLDKISDNTSNIWAGYIQKSNIKASGSVVTAKEGAYNSNIYSGNKVIFKGEPGLFRGGKIIANNDVFIKYLGSPGGSKVEVQVSVDCKIEADKVYPNVVIKIGDQKHKFDDDYGRIAAYLDNDGKLQLN